MFRSISLDILRPIFSEWVTLKDVATFDSSLSSLKRRFFLTAVRGLRFECNSVLTPQSLKALENWLCDRGSTLGGMVIHIYGGKASFVDPQYLCLPSVKIKLVVAQCTEREFEMNIPPILYLLNNARSVDFCIKASKINWKCILKMLCETKVLGNFEMEMHLNPFTGWDGMDILMFPWRTVMIVDMFHHFSFIPGIRFEFISRRGTMTPKCLCNLYDFGSLQEINCNQALELDCPLISRSYHTLRKLTADSVYVEDILHCTQLTYLHAAKGVKCQELLSRDETAEEMAGQFLYRIRRMEHYHTDQIKFTKCRATNTIKLYVFIPMKPSAAAAAGEGKEESDDDAVRWRESLLVSELHVMVPSPFNFSLIQQSCHVLSVVTLAVSTWQQLAYLLAMCENKECRITIQQMDGDLAGEADYEQLLAENRARYAGNTMESLQYFTSAAVLHQRGLISSPFRHKVCAEEVNDAVEFDSRTAHVTVHCEDLMDLGHIPHHACWGVVSEVELRVYWNSPVEAMARMLYYELNPELLEVFDLLVQHHGAEAEEVRQHHRRHRQYLHRQNRLIEQLSNSCCWGSLLCFNGWEVAPNSSWVLPFLQKFLRLRKFRVMRK